MTSKEYEEAMFLAFILTVKDILNDLVMKLPQHENVIVDTIQPYLDNLNKNHETN